MGRYLNDTVAAFVTKLGAIRPGGVVSAEAIRGTDQVRVWVPAQQDGEQSEDVVIDVDLNGWYHAFCRDQSVLSAIKRLKTVDADMVEEVYGAAEITDYREDGTLLNTGHQTVHSLALAVIAMAVAGAKLRHAGRE